ncbi:MAG: ribonuclease E/G, partial [Rhodospirillaceae bacterium]|nr:ribonuclease E/G [Rhodospirillaceae bacterium]
MSEQTILIRNRPGETRIARIDDKSTLLDFAVYRGGSDNGGQLVGEVFLGRVRRVVPAMEAAFVDIGQEKDAFLGLSDARAQPHFGPNNEIDKISDYVHEGEAILVQVLTDARETKGAKITKRVNVTGDTLVFSALGDGSARVSSRIKNKAERTRLLGLAENMLKNENTIIVRSAAENADEKDLKAELETLKNKWNQLLEMASNAKAPAHIGINENALEKYLKDTGRKSVTRIISDDASIDNCEIFSGGDIFKKFNISDQVDGLLEPVVNLKSGGSIIIEETAALT